MAKRKTAKYSILVTVLCLVLCGAMVLGGTYAWFSDKVESNNNIITTGTLKAKMYWADGTEAVPASDSGWKDASEGAIFNNKLWEPGHTEVRHIKVENDGSLAFKFDLRVIADDLGKEIKLSDVIDVYFANPAEQIANRSDLTKLTRVGTLSQLMADEDGAAYGKLLADETDTYTIALKMQEEAGNEYQNKTIGENGISIRLYAEQYAHEEDSFDANYDATLEITYPATGQDTLKTGASAIEISIMDQNNKKAGSVVVPAGAIEDKDEPVEVVYSASDYTGNFTIAAGLEKKVVDVKVTNLNGNVPVKVVLKIADDLDPNTVELYHNDTKIDCTYNPNTGYVTFESKTFSPFTIVYKADSSYVPTNPEGNNLPVADVKTIALADEDIAAIGRPLETAYVFICEDDPDAAAASPYATWYCDFYVKLNKDLGANQIYLAGNYGPFGWIGFSNDELTLEADTEIPLLGSVVDNPWTYADIASFVGEFKCGVSDVDDALKGADFTVMLRLTNPENKAEFYNVATITHTFA